jgi:5S rRNA maturation endonuclease (ribonuclease M5)
MAVMGRTRPTIKPGLNIPKATNKVPEWPIAILKWLYSYYIFDDVIKKHRIRYVEDTNSLLYTVIKDNEVVFAQTRGFPNKHIRGIGAKQLYKTDNGHNTVVIVEDYISAIRLAENNVDAICLFGTSINDCEIKPILDKWDNVITWLDGDEAGIKGRKTIEKKLNKQINELKLRFPLRYTQNWSILNVSSELDPKEYSDNEIRSKLNDKNR